MTIREITWETVDPVRTAASAYSRQLRRELETIVETETASDAKARVDAARRAIDKLDANPVDWPTIYATEADLIRLVDEATIRRRAWFIRDRFTDVVGSEKAARYLASGAPNITTGKVEDLRADLLEVEREMAYHLTFRRQSERERARLLRTVSNLTVAIIFVFFCFVAWDKFLLAGKVAVVLTAALAIGTITFRYWAGARARRAPKPPSRPNGAVAAPLLLALTLGTFCGSARAAVTPPTDSTATQTSATQTSTTETVSKETKALYTAAQEQAAKEDLSPNDLPSLAFAALAGLLGAAFSLLQRAQRSEATDPQVALFSFNEAGFHTFLISMLCGLISAIAIYAVFAGDMVSGVLFPKIVNGVASRGGFALSTERFLRMSGPATIVDHAKLLVWAFIGGFSERFVPDVLDRFVNSTKK